MNIHLRRVVENSYPIHFVGSPAEISEDIGGKFNKRPSFILTDTNVARLYGNMFYRALKKHKAKCHLLVIPPGEKSKSRAMKETLEDKLISRGVSRDSLLIALGGGVIGDIGGFTAATILRGIDYIQIPTSLLAQVDSSIGGKVALDHPRGKNLIGAFYQPKAVYISVRMLRTLPEKEYVNGLAEIIKYAAILDKNLFRYLERERDKIFERNIGCLSYIVRRCCELKRSIVESDERERGPRRILNFGHTIGHAIEQCSDYRLRHGEAIAIGMAKEAGISLRLGLMRQHDYNRLTALISSYRLPLKIPRTLPVQSLIRIIQSDKKTVSGRVHYTLLRGLGNGAPGIEVPSGQVLEALRS